MVKELLLVYLFISILITTHCATFVMPWSKGGYKRSFSFVCFSMTIYLFAYLLEIVATKLEDKMFWNLIGYIGMSFAAALWCATVILYVQRHLHLPKKIAFVIFAIPSLTVIFRINDSWLHLIFTSYRIQEAGRLSLLTMDKSSWFFVQSFFECVLIATALVLIFLQAKKSVGTERRRYLLLLLATAFPILGAALRLIEWRALPLNYTALALPISLYLILFAIAKYDILEAKTLVRDSVFDSNTDVMILLDLDGRVMDLNRSAINFFNRIEVPVKYTYISEMLDQRQDLAELFASEKNKSFKIHVGEELKYYEIGSGIMRSPSGQKIGVLKTIWDISEEKSQLEKVSIQATTDELTGLNNRREFLKEAASEFDRALRYESTFCVLMLDLDHFKVVNDTWGHAAGDEVLRKVGSMMLTNFRRSDILGRIGGEEFSVILNDVDLMRAKQVAEKFRKEIERMSICYQGNEIKLTISIGIAEFNKKHDNFQEIMLHADEALYESKTWGRNRTSLYSG